MRRPRPRLLARFLMASVPALGLLLAISPAAGASTTPASAAARAATIARQALQHLSVGQHAADHQVFSPSLKVKGLTQVQSTNWSGYADTGSGFSTVTGSWTEPSASCTSTTSLAAFWVGIDGYSSSSVEQDGTLIECYRGVAYQYTWWEMYPTNAIQVVGSSLRAGDSITASVVRSGSSYTLKVTDSSRSGGQLYHHPVLLRLRQFQRRVDSGSAQRQQWRLPAVALQHLDRLRLDGRRPGPRPG